MLNLLIGMMMKKKRKKLKKPKKESLGESLLAKVETELPAKVAEIKERE